VRKALLGSLGFHVGLTIVVFQWVAFQQVRYVPRDVYSVKLVSAGTASAAARVTAAPPEPAPPKPEPVKEEKEEQMPPPPDTTKKKPATKKDDKAVPSTDVRKTDARPDSLLAGEGTGGGSAPVAGGVTFDGGDFPFAPFIGRMRQKIAAAWEVPAGSAGVERSAVVYFRAHRDGSVSHVAVEQSSGVPLFDRSCQRAVLQAAPLPPLPREYRDEYVGVHFSFLYQPTP
jgi:TonB family protein